MLIPFLILELEKIFLKDLTEKLEPEKTRLELHKYDEMSE